MFLRASSCFLCDVIRSCKNAIKTFFGSFLPFYKRQEELKDKRKDHGAVDEPSME